MYTCLLPALQIHAADATLGSARPWRRVFIAPAQGRIIRRLFQCGLHLKNHITRATIQLQVFLWLHADSIAGGIYGSTAQMYIVVPVSYATMGDGGWSAGGSDSRNGVVRKMRMTPTQEACAQEGRRNGYQEDTVPTKCYPRRVSA